MSLSHPTNKPFSEHEHPWWTERGLISDVDKKEDLLLLFMSMGWDYVSELRPSTGLLFIPKMIHEYGESWRNDTDRKKQNNSEKSCSSNTLSKTNPIRIDQGATPGLRCERPATNRLSHCTAETPSVYTRSNWTNNLFQHACLHFHVHLF
jgi:hypothetical protein